MTLKVLIGTLPGGLHLHKCVVEQMYRDQPSLFKESFNIVELFGIDPFFRNMVEDSRHTVVIDDNAFELPMSIEVRSNPWLVAKFEGEGSAGLVAPGAPDIKFVEIPLGVECYVYKDDDFSEAVHEMHRVWK